MQNFILYFFIFLIYSFIGWLMETILVLITTKKLVDRGFLIGPYCPIYGFGCLLMIKFLTPVKNNIILLFILAILICGTLEYFTSYIMEKLFKARWWDYSTKKFNINGRVCLETLLPFGILGTFIMYVATPFFVGLINQIPQTISFILSIVLIILFIIDNIVSFIIVFNLRGTIKDIMKDNTEEITEKVKEIIKKRSIIYKRLVKAFPNLKIGN